ncbi:hypothetical protein N9937_00600 [bacterium]|nr:hypothetical protein [bacterium]
MMKKYAFWFVVLLAPSVFAGCVVSDFFLGKDNESLRVELDANEDGIVTKDEVIESGYDANLDGILDEAEVAEATKPNAVTDMVLALLAALNIPGIPIGLSALQSARKKKRHILALIRGIDDAVDKISADGKLTKDDLYTALDDAKKLVPNAKELEDVVEAVKVAYREEKGKA